MKSVIRKLRMDHSILFWDIRVVVSSKCHLSDINSINSRLNWENSGNTGLVGDLSSLIFPGAMDDKPLGILRVHVKRGINLAIRDSNSSDPYVVLALAHQKLKTRVINNNCNPVWNEQLTFSVKDVNDPIRLTVFDKDRFSGDDKMGDAEIELRPFLEVHQMGLDFQKLPNGCAIKRIRPARTNCLVEESNITWINGKIKQDMVLRLKNVECGEVEIMLEWTDGPGCKGLGREGSKKTPWMPSKIMD